MKNSPKGYRKPRSMRIQNLHIGSHVILCLWSLIVLIPLYVLVTGSFKTKISIFTNVFGLPEIWNISNYTDVIKRGNFPRYFLNTLIVVCISLLLVLIIGVAVSYALANWRSKLSTAFYFFFIAGMMIPIKIASIQLIEIMKALGLHNTIWALVPIYVAMGIPISVFILTEFIRQIPRSLIEAALMDGSSRFKVLIRIILPLSRPALATVAIYNLIPFWNDLWFPLIMISDDKQKTLLLGVTKLFGEYVRDWSKILAVLTLSALPVLILYLLMSQQFIKGMTSGAIKE